MGLIDRVCGVQRNEEPPIRSAPGEYHKPPYRNPVPELGSSVPSAPDILRRAAQHMDDRAAARDQPGGERSMKRTVDAFNALTGHDLSERDGWMFMAALKMARACTTPTGLADDYEDLAAYAGLAGECAAKHRVEPMTDDKL